MLYRFPNLDNLDNLAVLPRNRATAILSAFHRHRTECCARRTPHSDMIRGTGHHVMPRGQR